MARRLEPTLRAVLIHKLFPEDEGTEVRRWATEPLADSAAWTEGRIYNYSEITRKLSQPNGSYDVATARVELSDDDWLFRGLLAEAATRYIAGCEFSIEILSDAGREDGGEWRPLIRGRVSDVQCTPGLRAVIEVTDELGAQFTGYDLDKTVGVPMTRAIFPGLPASNIDRILPMVMGEHSDLGAVDQNGDPADKGMLPALDAGWASIGSDGTLNPDNATIGRLPAPEGLLATIVGTAGTRTRTYTVTAFSAIGETTAPTPIDVSIPDDLGDDEYVTISWTPVDGAAAYGVYVNGRRSEIIDAGYSEWVDDGSLTGGGPSVPSTNSAFVDEDINGVTFSVWRMFVLKIGPAAEVNQVYGASNEVGVEPRRVRLDESVFGEQVLVYGRPGWPHADPFIELNGVRVGVLYARGPIAQHAISGDVTIAWNGCGDPENADGTGNTITEAFYVWQHFINEYCFKDNGVGYRTGDYGPTEEFDDGTEKIRTSSVEECQDLTVEWIGGRGYQASVAIYEPISLREFDKRFRTTFASYTGSNHWGQIVPVLINDEADPDEGRAYIDYVNVIRMESQRLRHDQVVTKVTFHYDWDSDGQRFRQPDLVLEDELATQAHGGRPREQSPRQCFYTRDAATAWDAAARYLTRYKVPPREVAIRVDLTGLEDEIGTQVRLTHYDGFGVGGDVLSPMLVIGHTVDPSLPGAESTVLLLFDLLRISTFVLPLLADEATDDSIVLYDETVDEPPPVGAYECR